MNILIADDDRTSRVLLAGHVSRLGHRVNVASDGLTALQQLTGSAPPQIAILDWMMPGMDGPNVCRAIRDKTTGQYIYIILLTAKSKVVELVEGLDSGADDYMTKPVATEELGARLRAGQRLISLQEQLIHARERLRDQATHDGLTGLWNRNAIHEILFAQIDRCRRDARPLGLMLCDLDHFKRINDTYGHLAGDAVLRAVAERLTRAVRQSDFIGRFGGEEFLMVLPDCDPEQLGVLAERTRASICGQEVRWNAARIQISVSVGAVRYPLGPPRLPDALIHTADNCLLEAKRAGRNRVVIAPG